MKHTVLIKAVKVDGGYIHRAENGELPTEGQVIKTRAAAYQELQAMYANSTWHGRKVHGGYRIDID